MKSGDYSQLNQLGGGAITMPESPDEARLETVRNPHADSPYLIRFACPEFTSLCPVTGQPDFAHLVIDYIPGEYHCREQILKTVSRVFSQSGRISRGMYSRHCQAARR